MRNESGGGIFRAAEGERERETPHFVQRPSPRTMTVGQDQDMTKWSRIFVRGGDVGGANDREGLLQGFRCNAALTPMTKLLCCRRNSGATS
jgi:hypothetical protein